MKLERFLVKAKSGTYASGQEAGAEILADGGKQLIHEADGYRYRDRYFGWNPFAGEEVVWRNDRILWVMNYYGTILSEAVSADHVYQFLRKAMCGLTEERPFRGPNEFREDEWVYCDCSEGTVARFIGIEQIFYRGEVIYRLDYHGGKVGSK